MASRDQNPLAPALAAGGALLLFIGLLLNWFSLDVKAQGQTLSIGVARPDVAVLLLVLAIAAAAAIAAGRFRGMLSGQSAVLAGLGAVTFLYILVNIIKKPQLLDLTQTAFDEAQKQAGAQIAAAGADFSVGIGPGLWIALVGSLLLLAAGLVEILGVGSGARTPAGATLAPRGPGGPGGPAGGGAAPPPPPPTPAQPATPPPPADRTPGWQPDPYGQARLRYWDGNSWTQHTG
jgi:hypothetical protein